MRQFENLRQELLILKIVNVMATGHYDQLASALKMIETIVELLDKIYFPKDFDFGRQFEVNNLKIDIGKKRDTYKQIKNLGLNLD